MRTEKLAYVEEGNPGTPSIRIDYIYPNAPPSFFVNPFKLQQMKDGLSSAMLPISEAALINFAAEGSLSDCLGDVAIIDTPAGCQDVILQLCRKQYRIIILVGETIQAGDAERLLNDILIKTGRRVFALSTYDSVSILKLLNAVIFQNNLKTVNDVSNIIYICDNDTIVKNPISSQNESNAIIDISAFENDILTEFEKTGIRIHFEALSSGCDNDCTFCVYSASGASGKLCEVAGSNINNLVHLLRNSARTKYIQFTDSNFMGGDGTRIMRVRDWISRLKESDQSGNLRIGIDTRLDTIIDDSDNTTTADERKRAWLSMKGVGLRHVFLGLETFSLSQSIRYNKHIKASVIRETLVKATDFLSANGILYTIGLILFDPLMGINDLLINLEAISSLDLLGKTASLLKEMRIYERSPYFKKYSSQITRCPYGVTDYVFVDSEDLLYQDETINSMISSIRFAYRLLNNSGYRHSDVPHFPVLYSSAVPQPMLDLPKKVAAFEYELLLWLIENAEKTNSKDSLDYSMHTSAQLIASIMTSLNTIDENKLTVDEAVAYRYFIRCFSRATDTVSSLL